MSNQHDSQVLSSGILTLMTDFGSQDCFVGVMKGVILSRFPQCTLVDLTHDIPNQDVRAAGYQLKSSYSYFPSGTVHLCVVDPGVGSDRRVLAALLNGHIFVLPDNGILSYIAEPSQYPLVVSVERDELFLKPVCHTFHGRDIFSPIAAFLASLSLARGSGAATDGRLLRRQLLLLGPEVSDWIRLCVPQPIWKDQYTITGEIVMIDKFGNCITNIDMSFCDNFLAADKKNAIKVTLCENYVINRISKCYADETPNSQQKNLLAIISSNWNLELAINGGNAAKSMQLIIGDPVVVNLLPGSSSTFNAGLYHGISHQSHNHQFRQPNHSGSRHVNKNGTHRQHHNNTYRKQPHTGRSNVHP